MIIYRQLEKAQEIAQVNGEEDDWTYEVSPAKYEAYAGYIIKIYDEDGLFVGVL